MLFPRVRLCSGMPCSYSDVSGDICSIMMICCGRVGNVSLDDISYRFVKLFVTFGIYVVKYVMLDCISDNKIDKCYTRWVERADDP